MLAEDGQVGMELYPASMKPFIKEGRRYQVDPLVQWKKEGDCLSLWLCQRYDNAQQRNSKPNGV